MRVPVLPLKGNEKSEAFELEVNADDTMEALKKGLMEKLDVPLQQLQLLLAGRILKDHMRVRDTSLKDGARLVVLISSKRQKDIADLDPDERPASRFSVEGRSAPALATAAAAPSAPLAGDPAIATAPTTDAAGAAESAAVIAEPAGVAPAAVLFSVAAAGLDPGASVASRHVSGDDFEAAVAQLCEIGFERMDVERCLQLAHGNPDRAAEFLMFQPPPREVPEERNVRALVRDLATDLAPMQRARAEQDFMETVANEAASMAATGSDPVTRMIAAAIAAQVPNSAAQIPAVQLPATGWEVQAQEGWIAWQPGVPFRGEVGEEIRFAIDHHRYIAIINSYNSGVQRNVATGTERPLRRGGASGLGAMPPFPVPGDFGRVAMPALMDNEVELAVSDASTFEAAQCTRSELCTVDEFKFRLLVFPHGTQSTNGTHVSAFVEAQQPGPAADWCVPMVKYQIALVNWVDYRCSIVKVDTCTFSPQCIDRGWHDMIKVSELSAESGWLGPNGSLLLRACVRVAYPSTVAPGQGYSSRQRTGHVCLQSRGDGSCYTTSLLQSLFHITPFRELAMSATCLFDKELQQVFRSLQTSDAAVSCEKLLGDLGFVAGGMAECDLNSSIRAFCECLEDKAGAGRELFEGEMESYIACLDVDYKSTRVEKFLSLPLSLRDDGGQRLHGIVASLDHLMAEELLEGENAYEAEGHGKQRAKKGLRLNSLPSVLWLDLKRCQLDHLTMQVTKSNAEFPFPERLDLTKYVAGSGTYRLHTVVVQHGDAKNGHCHLHVKPTAAGGWLQVTDSHVLPCSTFASVEANYGGKVRPVWNYFHATHTAPGELDRIPRPQHERRYSACLLGYVREDEHPVDK